MLLLSKINIFKFIAHKQENMVRKKVICFYLSKINIFKFLFLVIYTHHKIKNLS